MANRYSRKYKPLDIEGLPSGPSPTQGTKTTLRKEVASVKEAKQEAQLSNESHARVEWKRRSRGWEAKCPPDLKKTTLKYRGSIKSIAGEYEVSTATVRKWIRDSGGLTEKDLDGFREYFMVNDLNLNYRWVKRVPEKSGSYVVMDRDWRIAGRISAIEFNRLRYNNLLLNEPPKKIEQKSVDVVDEEDDEKEYLKAEKEIIDKYHRLLATPENRKLLSEIRDSPYMARVAANEKATLKLGKGLTVAQQIALFHPNIAQKHFIGDKETLEIGEGSVSGSVYGILKGDLEERISKLSSKKNNKNSKKEIEYLDKLEKLEETMYSSSEITVKTD